MVARTKRGRRNAGFVIHFMNCNEGKRVLSSALPGSYFVRPRVTVVAILSRVCREFVASLSRVCHEFVATIYPADVITAGNHQIYAEDVITANLKFDICPPLVKGLRKHNASCFHPSAARLRREAPKIWQFASFHTSQIWTASQENLCIFVEFSGKKRECCPFLDFSELRHAAPAWGSLSALVQSARAAFKFL